MVSLNRSSSILTSRHERIRECWSAGMRALVELPGRELASTVSKARRSDGAVPEYQDPAEVLRSAFFALQPIQPPTQSQPSPHLQTESSCRLGRVARIGSLRIINNRFRRFNTVTLTKPDSEQRNRSVSGRFRSHHRLQWCSFCTMHLMAIRKPAEYVASRTWNTLARVKQLRARFGEETLTDLLMLDMLPPGRARGYWIRSTTKWEESLCGADLLVAVRHSSGAWSRLAVQAKKLYANEKYGALGPGKSTNQLQTLDSFARQVYALPLYLLYNYSRTVDRCKHWHCCRRFTRFQLGCTLVPSWHIRQVINSRPPRGFNLAHCVYESIPWRCAFYCPHGAKPLQQLAFQPQKDDRSRLPAEAGLGSKMYDWPFEPLENGWPDWLFREWTTELTREAFDQFWRQLAETSPRSDFDQPRGNDTLHRESLYPTRLLLVDQAREPSTASPDSRV